MAERLIRLANPARAAALFKDWPETPVWSALEGCMGSIWTIAAEPKAALCENGDFLFLAGAADENETRLLLEAWKAARADARILVPREEACGSLIEQIYGLQAVRSERIAFAKGMESFDPVYLHAAAQKLPEKVTVVPFDADLYKQAKQQQWSLDFVSQFRDAEDFLQRGVGFAALHGGELVGGASSYIRYSGGIEIQVETRRNWQRRGIASACCAMLILECLSRGLYPSWDAANPASAALAEKLGYCRAENYPVWEIHFSR